MTNRARYCRALFCIFAAMVQKKYTRVLWVFIVLLLISGKLHQLSAAPVPGCDLTAKETILNTETGLPHDALEKTQAPVAVSAQLLSQKNTLPPFYLPATAWLCNNVFPSTLYQRQTALRVKEYLYQIHPYHHFW
ncbi:MAG: hypothetical protein JNM88_12100 [Chitinophagaceae bacterium]|nr:hypothetical protein [Chitinophagaceae bacterium]